MNGITPQGKQREVMALPTQGHFIVLGAAGSGKTTMALLRAEFLANLPGNAKVLLVTFNCALIKYIKRISGTSSHRLTIENYHTWARGYLNSRGKMPPRNGIFEPEEKLSCINQALVELRRENLQESTLRRPVEFFVDEISFIQRFGFVDFGAYRDAERIGRAGANLSRDNRRWIYEVYIRYITLRKDVGRMYDWDDLAYYAYLELQNDNTKRLYSHIIIDEGQDFSPMMIRSLVAAIENDGSFMFFGDVAQQIYGSRLSWRDSGIDCSRIWRFDVNYRNSKAIMDFSNDITHSRYWQQDRDMVVATNQIAEGPKPLLVRFNREEHEIAWVVNRAIATGRISSTVIICRNRADIRTFMRVLNRSGYSATEIDRETPGYAHIKTIYLTTYHAAKGLEFENVLILFLSAERFPDPDTVNRAISEDEALSNEIRLLYVAVTRAMDALYMTYSGNLSPLFPKKSDNFNFSKEEDL